MISSILNFLFGNPSPELKAARADEEVINTNLDEKVSGIWGGLQDLITPNQRPTKDAKDLVEQVIDEVNEKIHELKRKGKAEVELIRRKVSEIIKDYPKLKLHIEEPEKQGVIKVKIADHEKEKNNIILNLILAKGIA